MRNILIALLALVATVAAAPVPTGTDDSVKQVAPALANGGGGSGGFQLPKESAPSRSESPTDQHSPTAALPKESAPSRSEIADGPALANGGGSGGFQLPKE
ncbi:hypothetical protein BC831DRAFT_435914 [Entophlyctis helioformis]|nr:hypothetical protein BC831DRAFT_435914 [Entophlyctis helioformis]